MRDEIVSRSMSDKRRRRNEPTMAKTSSSAVMVVLGDGENVQTLVGLTEVERRTKQRASQAILYYHYWRSPLSKPASHTKPIVPKYIDKITYAFHAWIYITSINLRSLHDRVKYRGANKITDPRLYNSELPPRNHVFRNQNYNKHVLMIIILFSFEPNSSKILRSYEHRIRGPVYTCEP